MINKVLNKEKKSYEIYEDCMNKIKNINNKEKILVSVNEEKYNDKCMLPVALKDNIAYKGLSFTCGSKSLEGFNSPYNAELVEKLKQNSIYVLCKINMSEFGYAEDNYTKKAIHDLDIPLVIETDTMGNLRIEEIKNDIINFKPTYGRISRYGVAEYSSSMDTVSLTSKELEDIVYVYNAISGKTEENRDPFLVDRDEKIDMGEVYESDEIDKTKKIAGINIQGKEEIIKNTLGSIDEVQIEDLSSIFTISDVITMADLSSSTGKIDGVSFGIREQGSTFDEIVTNTRTKGITLDVKKRIMLGTYVVNDENIGKYYIKSAEIRRKIISQLENIFKKYDALIYVYDLNEDNKNYGIIANLAGIPRVTMKLDNNYGIQIMTKKYDELKALQIANKILKNGK